MQWIISWRTSLRVARREARRAKGRSTLIAALIGLPVLALAFAAVSYDMFTLTKPESLTRTLGAAEASIEQRNMPIKQDPEARIFVPVDLNNYQARPPLTEQQLLALLPTGTRLVPNQWVGLQVRHGDAISHLRATSADLNDPVNRGRLKLLSGRAAMTPAEVLLNPKAADRLGVNIGGQLVLDTGEKFTVVGLVEQPSDFIDLAVFPVQALPGGSPEPTSVLIDAPAPVTWDQVRMLNQHGLLVLSRAVVLDPPPFDPSELGVGFADGSSSPVLGIAVLIGGMALLEVVLLAGPAFAVGARRRQRELALVAANGGTPAHVRRVVLADGVILGAVGAVAGIIAGILVAFAARGLLEDKLFNARAGAYRVFPLALLAIAGVAIAIGIAAALVPAFTVARQNVVQALTGRRGIVRSRKRWLALGLAMIAGGALIGMYAAQRASANIILAGLILAELGAALCTPSLVGLLSRAGRILPLSPRIALRDAARNRASAAPAIAAVMAAVAGTVAMGVYLNSSTIRQWSGYEPTLPVGTAYVQNANLEDPWTDEQLAAAEAALRSDLPVTKAAVASVAGCVADPATAGEKPTEPAAIVSNGSGSITVVPQTCELQFVPSVAAAHRCPYENPDVMTQAQRRAAHKDSRCASAQFNSDFGLGRTLVDDGSALGLLTGATGADLDSAIATLKAGGIVLASDRYLRPDGTVHLTVNRYGGEEQVPPLELDVPGFVLSGDIGGSRVIVPPALVTSAHGVVKPIGVIAATGKKPTSGQEDRARATVRDRLPNATFGIERGPQVRTDPRLWVLTGAAILVTIGAAAMATGLAAADGRAELSTLGAVGASPRVRRFLSLSQSGVIAGLGSILGTAAGLGAAWAVLVGLNAQYAAQWPSFQPDYPITAPWTRVLVGLVVAPLVAMIGAGLLVRSRLPIERRTT